MHGTGKLLLRGGPFLGCVAYLSWALSWPETASCCPKPAAVQLGEEGLGSLGAVAPKPIVMVGQAWTETLWGHIKAENPHLLTITDQAVLAVELERVRHEYNTVRLHETIGYVTPNDEHQGHREAVRKTRIHGLTAADIARRCHHKNLPS